MGRYVQSWLLAFVIGSAIFSAFILGMAAFVYALIHFARWEPFDHFPWTMLRSTISIGMFCGAVFATKEAGE